MIKTKIFNSIISKTSLISFLKKLTNELKNEITNEITKQERFFFTIMNIMILKTNSKNDQKLKSLKPSYLTILYQKLKEYFLNLKKNFKDITNILIFYLFLYFIKLCQAIRLIYLIIYFFLFKTFIGELIRGIFLGLLLLFLIFKFLDNYIFINNLSTFNKLNSNFFKKRRFIKESDVPLILKLIKMRSDYKLQFFYDINYYNPLITFNLYLKRINEMIKESEMILKSLNFNNNNKKK